MSVHQKCCSEDLQIQCKLQALQVSEKQKRHIRINQSWKKTVDKNLRCCSHLIYLLYRVDFDCCPLGLNISLKNKSFIALEVFPKVAGNQRPVHAWGSIGRLISSFVP